MIHKRIHNTRYPHTCKITRSAMVDNFSDEEEDTIEIYKGECHSFVGRGGNDNKVLEGARQVSIPMSLLDWGKAPYTRTPNINDYIVVNINTDLVEEGAIEDVIPDNFRTIVKYTLIRG